MYNNARIGTLHNEISYAVVEFWTFNGKRRFVTVFTKPYRERDQFIPRHLSQVT